MTSGWWIPNPLQSNASEKLSRSASLYPLCHADCEAGDAVAVAVAVDAASADDDDDEEEEEASIALPPPPPPRLLPLLRSLFIPISF